MVNLQSYLYEHFSKNNASVFAFVKWLAQAHHLEGELRLLDIGCGPGTLLEDYARLGWQVTGLEPDADFYTAASQATAAAANIQVQKGGFQDIDDYEEYDLILAVNDPFAYLIDVSQRLDALRRVFNALRPWRDLFLRSKKLLLQAALPRANDTGNPGDQWYTGDPYYAARDRFSFRVLDSPR